MALAIGFGSMLLALAAACPAQAQDPSSESAWIPARAVAPASSHPSNVPGPSGHPAPAPSDNTPVAPEQSWFWDMLNDHVFSQLCRQVELPPGYAGRFGHFLLGGAQFSRRVVPMPFGNGRLAIVDQAGLNVGVGQLQKDFAHVAEGTLGLAAVARLQGNSIVVRPLSDEHACEDLLRTPPKSVVPWEAKRVSEMLVGEVWKIPLQLDLTFSAVPHAAIPIVPGGPMATVTVSLTAGREDASQVTLRRLDERTLRFRLHLDHATVRVAGGSAGVALLPLAHMPWPVGGDLLAQTVGHTAGVEIQRYLTASLGLTANRRAGERAVVEYLLDPADAEQMEALVRLVKGDLESLVNLGRKGTGPIWRDADRDPDLARELAQEHAANLGAAASFSGADRYQDGRHTLALKVPVALDYTRTEERAHDLAKAFDGGGTFNDYQVVVQKNRNLLDIPDAGQVYKRIDQRSVQAFTYNDGKGDVTTPELVVSHQAGFQAGSPRLARRMVENANSVFALAGTKGQGTNPATSLPVDQLLPETVKRYKMGALTDTLTFDQRAVQSIMQSQPADVVRSYVRTLSRGMQEKMDWVLAHGQLGADGKPTYDSKALLKDPTIHAGLFALWQIRRASQAAAALVADLAAARAQTTPNGQAKDLYGILGGGDAHLQLDRVVETFVQLVDPLDLSGTLTLQLAPKDKGAQRTSKTLSLNPDAKDPMVDRLQENRSRFANPSQYSD